MGTVLKFVRPPKDPVAAVLSKIYDTPTPPNINQINQELASRGSTMRVAEMIDLTPLVKIDPT